MARSLSGPWESRCRTWKAWYRMKDRCTNPKHNRFYCYGARGISYAPAWNDYKAFLADMGECPPGMFFDRIDNDKSYSKDNCRWVTKADSARNRRIVKLSVRKVQLIKAMYRAKRVGVASYRFCCIVGPIFGVGFATIQKVIYGINWPEVA